MVSPDFSLDPKIEAASVTVTLLALSELRLMNDSRFPWLLLVPQRPGVAEIVDLDTFDRAQLFDEIVIVSTVLRDVTGCDKLNVAALGNMVRQLHIHVIARFRNDEAWPHPVWGIGETVAYEDAERDRLLERIRKALPA